MTLTQHSFELVADLLEWLITQKHNNRFNCRSNQTGTCYLKRMWSWWVDGSGRSSSSIIVANRQYETWIGRLGFWVTRSRTMLLLFGGSGEYLYRYSVSHTMAHGLIITEAREWEGETLKQNRASSTKQNRKRCSNILIRFYSDLDGRCGTFMAACMHNFIIFADR